MKKILIKTYGFIGDILFASSIAQKLHEQYENVKVDYCIGFPQPYKLLKNNPYINEVFLSKHKGPKVTLLEDEIDLSKYDLIQELCDLDLNQPPTTFWQKHCGISSPTSEFKVYTDHVLDKSVEYELNLLNSDNNKIIGYPVNWEKSTIKYTKDEYENKLYDVEKIMTRTYNNTRDINYIIDELSKNFILIPLGYDHKTSQYYTALDSTSTYTNTASIIKNCDLIIGPEGGLTNLAAGVGTKCIITTDFMHILYGPKGIIKQIDDVKLGPKNLFPNGPHVNLDPFITDDEIINFIKNSIQ